MDAAARIKAVEERRAQRREAVDTEKQEQLATDLEALDALESEHGDGGVAQLELARYVKGLPTFIVIRTPKGIEYKRFTDQVVKASDKGGTKEKRDAQDMLARTCWLYPADDAAQKAMLDEYPALLLSIALRATQLVEAKANEEGKG